MSVTDPLFRSNLAADPKGPRLFLLHNLQIPSRVYHKYMATDIPYFEDEETKPQPGYPTVERETINAIVYDPATDEVLCLDWNNFDWKTFVIGGVEAGEDPVVGALREIEEETGYADLEFIADFGRMKSGYFAAHKNENRIANATGLIFKLKSRAQKEVSEEEKGVHTLVWLHRADVANFVNLSSQKYAWEKAASRLPL